MRPPITTATEPRQDRGLAVIYALLELVLVPAGLLLLVLTFVPGVEPADAPPASVDAHQLPVRPEPPALLIADPGGASGPRHPAVR
jgi:hypothetical protein